MCTRVTLRIPPEKVGEFFDVLSMPYFAPRYNIAPTQMVPIIRQQPAAKLECHLARWGLLPKWTPSLKQAPGLFNARAESVDTKPSFREPFKRQRCLFVTDGFYEWKTEGRKKLPYHFTRNDGNPLAIAGLWEEAEIEGARILSCTLVTTSANETVAPLHDRMPVVLEPEIFHAWLDPLQTDPAALKPLLRSAAKNVLAAAPVNPWLNNSNNEGPRCIEPPPVELDQLF